MNDPIKILTLDIFFLTILGLFLKMCDFLETHYLEEQVNAIKEISDHITQLKRVGSGLGEYEYDRRLDS